MVKNLPTNAGDTREADLIPGLGISPGVENSNSTLVFLPEESHEQRSLAGYNLWGHKEESDTNERLTLSLHFLIYINYVSDFFEKLPIQGSRFPVYPPLHQHLLFFG